MYRDPVSGFPFPHEPADDRRSEESLEHEFAPKRKRVEARIWIQGDRCIIFAADKRAEMGIQIKVGEDEEEKFYNLGGKGAEIAPHTFQLFDAGQSRFIAVTTVN